MIIPLDDHAKDGAFHLLQAQDGTLHCAFWDGNGWAYSSASRVTKPIAGYSIRLACAGRTNLKAR